VPAVITAGWSEATCFPDAFPAPWEIAVDVIEPLGLEEGVTVAGPVETP
jgi:hypothetical protein